MNCSGKVSLVGMILLSITVAFSQDPAPKQQPEKQGPAKFTSGAEEVSLDLVVRDKHGRPVRDLKASEIEIHDDGISFPVRSLQMSGSLGATTRTISEKGAAPPAGLKPTPTDPLKQVHLVSLLFETLDLKASKIAREAGYELLKGITSSNTFMAVLHVGPRVGVAQGFTNEREPLKKAIDTMTSPGKLDSGTEMAMAEEQLRHQASSGTQMAQIIRGDTSSVEGVGQSPGDPMALGMINLLLDVMETSRRVTRDQHARPAVASLLGVVRTMAKLPGRKVIVYFSEGLTLSEGVLDEFARLTGEANRAGVTIYTIDASGLDPDASTGDGDPFIGGAGGGLNQRRDSNSMSGIKRQMQTNDRVADAIRSNPHGALRDLAADTGGSFFGNTNDLRKPIHQLVEDEETYYLASYSPAIDGYDGHFRKVTVKINRPGVTVQTRSGYYALPPSAIPLQTFELPMLKALNDKTGQPDPQLRSRAFEFSPSADSVIGEIAVEVPLSHLQVREVQAEKSFRLHFSILALIRDQAGNIRGQFSEDVPYQLATEMKASALAGAYSFQRSFAVHRGKYRLEIAVYDHFSEHISTTQSDFEFAGVARPSLSEPLLVAKIEPPLTALEVDDPLLYEGKRITPRLTSDVRNDPGAALPIFFVMYPDKDAPAKPSLALQVLHSGTVLANVPMPLQDNGVQKPTPFIASIPLQNLNPGDYICRIVYSQGQARMQREISFSVKGERIVTPVKRAADDTPGATSEVTSAAEALAIEHTMLLGDASQLVFIQDPQAGRLTSDDQDRILAGARERALGYAESLPNFTVRESTRREISKSGTGNWSPHDAFTELVCYNGGAEERKLVEWNGKKADMDRSSLDGMMMNGEFGFLLGAVFNEKSQAKFAWKESVAAGAERYEVFTYEVDRAHSMYKLRTKSGHYAITAAYSGEVYLDGRTFHIRRVVLRAVGLPKESPIRAASLRLDYDRLTIGQSDHLVPTSGVLDVQTHRTSFERNQVRFSDYRRLGSETTIKFASQ